MQEAKDPKAEKPKAAEVLAAAGDTEKKPDEVLNAGEEQSKADDDAKTALAPAPASSSDGHQKDANLRRDLQRAIAKRERGTLDEETVASLMRRVGAIRKPSAKAKLDTLMSRLTDGIVKPLKEHITTETNRVVAALQGQAVPGQSDSERLCQIETAVANLTGEKRQLKKKMADAKAAEKEVKRLDSAAEKAAKDAAKAAERAAKDAERAAAKRPRRQQDPLA